MGDFVLVALASALSALVGLLVGLALWYRSRVAAQREAEQLRITIAGLQKEYEAAADKLTWTEQARESMRNAFSALASEALRANSETLTSQAKGNLEGIVGPLKTTLSSLETHVRELETSRAGAYEALRQQLTSLGQTHARLQETTAALTIALKTPSVRGRWGELQLRRVVEMAGMVNHVAFDEQARTESGRPDMIVHLPNGGILPIDSKVPLNAYMAAMEATEDEPRRARLADHAKAVRERAKDLGQKLYWDQFEKAPDFVVMFVPNEACLGAAYDADPALLEYAIEKKVLLAPPVNLLALLKAVAYGWQQQQITENALRIANEGRDLYSRLEIFVGHLSDVGKHLQRTVEAYNKGVGSMERRLVPAARRFQELGLSTSEIQAPKELEITPTLPALPEARVAADDDQI